jgi:hypothetical protein
LTYRADGNSANDARGIISTGLLRDIAVLLLSAALCLFLWSDLADLARGQIQLKQLIASQETTLKATTKAEAQLDSVARGIQQLAASGNPNAQKIVGVLHSNGVNIKP